MSRRRGEVSSLQQTGAEVSSPILCSLYRVLTIVLLISCLCIVVFRSSGVIMLGAMEEKLFRGSLAGICIYCGQFLGKRSVVKVAIQIPI